MRHGHAHAHFGGSSSARLSEAATISLTLLPKSSGGPECAGNASEPLHKKLIKSDGKDEQELLSRRAGLFPYIHTSKIGGGIKMQE